VLAYALLAILSRRPLTGYDLTRRFYGSVAFCWHAHQSQIYGELGRLERLGWVAAKAEVAGRRSLRKAFAITEPGRAALIAWLGAPPAALQLKDEWLLRVWAVDLLRPLQAAALLAACRRQHEERLRTYRALIRALEREHDTLVRTRHETLVGPYLCLQQGVWHEEMYVRWCRWAAGRLAARARRRGGRRAPPPADLHAVVQRARRAPGG
jgi:DNA-binding PadR family transcriptional regulator